MKEPKEKSRSVKELGEKIQKYKNRTNNKKRKKIREEIKSKIRPEINRYHQN